MACDNLPTCWALLIGVNLYPDNEDIKPLEGCVNDVEDIEQFLSSLKMVNTKVLKASGGNIIDCKKPIESEHEWPTLENVRQAINDIIHEATHGDLIYIHFSGHGVRRKTQSEDFGDQENGDLALVLYDHVSGCAYLQGFELATMLKEMIEKGLKPTVVLDCCYSGACLRKGGQPRIGLREAFYDAEVDRRSSNRSISRDILVALKPTRNANALPAWFLDPQGYGILTACGPSEISREISVLKTKRGPLSYFISIALNSLRRQNTTMTLKSVHDYVTLQFHAGFITQTPRRYGNDNTYFFKYLNQEHNHVEIRVLWRQDELILEAGQAHGVLEGEEFSLHPPWHEEADPILFKAKEVHALTSVLEAVDTGVYISKVKTAWRAIPRTHLSGRLVSVAFSARVHSDSWEEMIAKSSFLQKSVSPGSDIFIDVNEDSGYQLLNRSGCSIPGLPKASILHTWTVADIINVLDHMARFNYIERIENRIVDQDFEDSIIIQMKNSTGPFTDNTGVLNVAHGETVKLRCINRSTDKAYLSIFNLSPRWGVHDLLKQKSGGFMDLPSEAETILPLNMTIPEELYADGRCVDVIKVFVTNRPVTLASLCLPTITPDRQRSSYDLEKSGRSLLEFVGYLSPITRRPQSKMLNDKWLTRRFIIEVSK